MMIMAFICFGWAVVLMIFSGPLVPLAAVLHGVSPGILNGLQSGIQRYVGSDFWYWVFVPVLEQPSWLPPAVIGVLFVVANEASKRRAW